MKTIYKTITVLIYHKEIHMYKDLLKDAQYLFHNRWLFWENFTNYPTIGFYAIFSYLTFSLRAVKKDKKESGTEIGNSLEFDFCPTLFSHGGKFFVFLDSI